MRKTFFALGLAAGISALSGQDAGAIPADASSLREAATAGSTIERAQYIERRTRHGIVKCYRDLVIGPYRCHHYYGPL
jgi:hypothetical protein